MPDRELRHMSRTELVEIIFAHRPQRTNILHRSAQPLRRTARLTRS